MAKRSFRHFVEQELGKFPHFLIYCLLEWALIILLLIDGLLAFIANEFAKFFELKIPCLLCTRIDHVLLNRNPDFYYNDSFCEDHKKDVSSLAYCHVHKKLSDIRKMCEGCLLSFATERDSDCDTYKSLVGILHKDLECFVQDDQQIHLALHAGKKNEAMQVEKSCVQRCSCCGELLKMTSSYSKGKNAANLISPAPAPSPRAPFMTLRNDESRNLDLPHIRYTELKFISDSESELPEDEDGNAINQYGFCVPVKEEAKAVTVPLLTEADNLNEDKTPNYGRGNRFFGIPLTDSVTVSPRWARLNRKSPLELHEGNAPSDADGDSILHHLKRQVRLDRKSLMALYMELDEERSASAVAANNAMAMITRLQAEKAAVQMDALQYQRMMEEQAEYDQEALQEINNLLAKRDEEIKVLEAELEVYREKHGCLKEDDYMRHNDEADDEYQEFESQTCSSFHKIYENQPNEGDSNEVDFSDYEQENGEVLDNTLLG